MYTLTKVLSVVSIYNTMEIYVVVANRHGDTNSRLFTFHSANTLEKKVLVRLSSS